MASSSSATLHPVNLVAHGTPTDLLLDILERVMVLLLGGWLLFRFLPTLSDHPFNTLVLFSEGLIVLLIVVRRFGRQVNTLEAWAVAIVGTAAPLMILPVGEQFIPSSVAGAAMVTGVLLSILAKLFLQRRFGIVPANRGVERRGPYRLLRHPMYLGYLLCHLAYLGVSFSGWTLLVYTACWLAMIVRVRLEENILSEDSAYREYQRQVRWRLLPGVW